MMDTSRPGCWYDVHEQARATPSMVDTSGPE